MTKPETLPGLKVEAKIAQGVERMARICYEALGNTFYYKWSDGDEELVEAMLDSQLLREKDNK